MSMQWYSVTSLTSQRLHNMNWFVRLQGLGLGAPGDKVTMLFLKLDTWLGYCVTRLLLGPAGGGFSMGWALYKKACQGKLRVSDCHVKGIPSPL